MVWVPPNFNAGQYPPASDLEYAFDQIADLTHPGWTDWSSTFVLDALSVTPTKGNSTYMARYRKVPDGDVVDFEFYILIGSTFSAGSGVYEFPVPHAPSSGAILCALGPGYIFDSGTANRTGVMRFAPGGYLEWYLNGATAAITHTGSGTAWATGDIITGSIRYEPA
jgi:hypothetical protein